MVTSNDYLLSYGPLALTLTTAIIDIALTTNTYDNSPKSQQGAKNLYKSLRHYYPSTIALASTWSSGYLTYINLSNYTGLDDLSAQVSNNPSSVFLTAPVISSGVAVGLTGINAVARICSAASTNSRSSDRVLKANNVFNILECNVLPQLSGGLIVGTVGGAVAGAINLLIKKPSVVTNAALNLIGVQSNLLTSIQNIAPAIITAIGNIPTATIDALIAIPTANITALTNIPAARLTSITNLPVDNITALTNIPADTLTSIINLPADNITALTNIPAATLTSIINLPADNITALGNLTLPQIENIANIPIPIP